MHSRARGQGTCPWSNQQGAAASTCLFPVSHGRLGGMGAPHVDDVLRVRTQASGRGRARQRLRLGTKGNVAAVDSMGSVAVLPPRTAVDEGVRPAARQATCQGQRAAIDMSLNHLGLVCAWRGAHLYMYMSSWRWRGRLDLPLPLLPPCLPPGAGRSGGGAGGPGGPAVRDQKGAMTTHSGPQRANRRGRTNNFGAFSLGRTNAKRQIRYPPTTPAPRGLCTAHNASVRFPTRVPAPSPTSPTPKHPHPCLPLSTRPRARCPRWSRGGG